LDGYPAASIDRCQHGEVTLRYPRERTGAAPAKKVPGFPTFFRAKRRHRVVSGSVWAFLRHANGEQLAGDRLERAKAFAEQAEEFFSAAANHKVRSRPLLYYYAFLNLGKVLLLHRGETLPNKVKHGIADPRANSSSSDLAQQKVVTEGAYTKPDEYNLYAGIHQVLDVAKTAPSGDHRILDLLEEVPAIHRTFELSTGKPSLFVPVKALQVRQDGKNVWARAVFDCGDATNKRAVAVLTRNAAFGSGFTRVDSETKESKNHLAVFQTQERAYKGAAFEKEVRGLAEEVRRVGVWTIATPNGYRYYVASRGRPRVVPQLLSIYAIMFFLGSVTRYRPHQYDKIVEKHAWLIDDFLATQPAQYLHLIASLIAGTEVLYPFALRAA
jgi:hypothetical protein